MQLCWVDQLEGLVQVALLPDDKCALWADVLRGHPFELWVHTKQVDTLKNIEAFKGKVCKFGIDWHLRNLFVVKAAEVADAELLELTTEFLHFDLGSVSREIPQPICDSYTQKHRYF